MNASMLPRAAWPPFRCLAGGLQCDTSRNACCGGAACVQGAPLPVPVGTCVAVDGQSPLDHYEGNALYNCFAGHGGAEIGSVALVQSPAACAELCDWDRAC